MNEGIGLKKEIDKLGRLVIPKKMRDMFNIQKEVELIITQEGILLRAPGFKLVKMTSSGQDD